MKKLGSIYKIENLVNGKVYIGQTIRKYERRMYEHRRKLRKGTHCNILLQNAYDKYGEKSFKTSKIIECDIDELDKLETELISMYCEDNLSYNLASGGNINKTLHELTKQKLSKITKELGWVGSNHPRARKVICISTDKIYGSITEASDELEMSASSVWQVCAGINVSTRGKDDRYYQFAYYEEGEKYELKKEINSSKTMRVLCVNTGELFDSPSDAGRKTNVNIMHIAKCCRGIKKHAGKMENGDYMVWVYEKDYDINIEYSFKRTITHSKETREKIKKAQTGKQKVSREYICTNLDTEEEMYFENREDVEKYIKELGYETFNIYYIHKCCNGHLKTTYNHTWKYA